MKKVKGIKKHKEAHSAGSKFGMGDFYGKAVRAKMGIARDLNLPGVNPVSNKKLKKPPKSLA